jgi:hypothetical protein
LARATQIDPAPARATSQLLDADLARLIERWPALSTTAERMILAAMEAHTGWH